MKLNEMLVGNIARYLIVSCALSCASRGVQQARADVSSNDKDWEMQVPRTPWLRDYSRVLVTTIDIDGQSTPDQKSPGADDSDTIHVPAYELPDTSFLSEQARVKVQDANKAKGELSSSQENCAANDGAKVIGNKEIERCEATALEDSALYKRLRDRYPVVISSKEIGGVSTEIFTPKRGIAHTNEKRVLINLHSGGFIGGWITNSRFESIPFASVSGIRVISIDYRESPEYTFPAATEDAIAVYREILKTYKPQNIGIFGCSSGGLLTAETIATLQAEHLPLPGAVGIFCSGAGYWAEGDSGVFARAIEGPTRMNGASNKNPYFRNTDLNDVLAFPIRSSSIMSKFPPTLIISATRDIALSSAVQTHSMLISRGVDAELHLWEGMGHAFFASPDYPDSDDVYSVTARFFDAHLSK